MKKLLIVLIVIAVLISGCTTPEPVCGDKACDLDESCSICPADCGECPVKSGVSHFGVHLGSLNYNLAVNHIRDLGEHIYVRAEFFADAVGWKKVKNNKQSIDLCNSCCNSSRSACDCNPDDNYYCDPEDRSSLLYTPILSEFYNNDFNLFGNFYSTGGYSDKPPINIITADYPHGGEDQYREYVSFIVQNFGDKIKYWEVGNENEAPGFWAGTPKEYADMLVMASEEIKQNCADCKVGISFAHPNISAKASEQRDEWHNVMGTVCDSFDFNDVHFYDPKFIEEGQLDRWKATCPGKEYISTETGILDNVGNKPQNSGGSLEKQAQDLAKYNTLLFAEGYNQIYMYLMDTDYGGGNVDTNPFLHNALIDEVTKQRKPAFDAYKTMIDKVDYFTSITKLADGQYKYTFSTKTPVYVLWCDSGTCYLTSEILSSTSQFKVTDYQGNEQTMNSNEISLTNSPVFVEGI